MQTALRSNLNKTLMWKTYCCSSVCRKHLLSTGIDKDALRSVALNPVSLPFHLDEKESVITVWNLCVPSVKDLRESVHTWSKMMSNRILSYDYALIMTSGLQRTELILSNVKMSATTETSSTTSAGATSKLPGAGSMDDLTKKWTLVKQKLPDWQNTISAKLQGLQDYINKKIKDVNVEPKKDC